MPLAKGGSVTMRSVMQYFPLEGNFHFRFRMQDDHFGYVWIDAGAGGQLDQQAPVVQGTIFVKVVQLPGHVRSKPINIDAGRFRSGGGGGPRDDQSVRSSLSSQVSSRQVSGNESRQPSRSPPPEADLMNFDGQGGGSGQRVRHGGGNHGLGDLGGLSVPAASNSNLPSNSHSHVSNLSNLSGAAPSAEKAAPAEKKAPLDREKLVEERLAKKQAAMDAASAKHEAAKAADEAKVKDRVEAGEQLKEQLDAWCKNPQDQKWRDVRTLLGTLDKVLWESATEPGADGARAEWTKVDVGDLMMDATGKKVKRAWQRAILITHPDKHNDSDGARRYRAERIFEAINESFKLYKDKK